MSAQRSRQGAMQGRLWAMAAAEAGRAAEGSAERYTKLSNADGTACCGRVGSRHFRSLEVFTSGLFVFVACCLLSISGSLQILICGEKWAAMVRPISPSEIC